MSRSPVLPRRRRLLPAAALTALVATACTGDQAPEPGGTPTAAPDDDAPPCPSVTELTARDVDASSADPAAAAQAVAAAAMACAELAVVVPADDPALAAVAAPLAAASAAPVLLDGDLDAALSVLGDPEVRRLSDEVGGQQDPDAPADDGDDGAAAGTTSDDDGTSSDGDVTALALAVADELDADRIVVADADDPAALSAAAALAAPHGDAVVPVTEDVTADRLGDREVVAVGRATERFPDAATEDDPWATDDSGDVVWAVDPAAPEAAATVAAAAVRGETVLPVPGGDLLGAETVAQIRAGDLDGDQLVPVGNLTEDPARDVALLTDAPLLPGGTLRYFEDSRMVAIYGRPGAPSLGVLGEQDLDATIDRAREVTEGYDGDGREVIPTLEVIVSVATGDPQADESYSNLTPAEEFRDLVDRAAEEDMQVILDLQPGRTDFLTQAQAYEDLLREPHVGLALDPEWRLEDDEVHLDQIGGVEAAEVQAVVDWYADLTRDAGLSQNLLVLHQFRLDMLRDRDTVEIPPEIAAVVHADGQGPQAMKMETWRTLTAEGADRWHWGWKNFYDEDPVVATPEEVLDLDPEVVLVTFQ